MTATAADYAWFDEHCEDLAGAYCLTLVQGLTPEQVVDRLGGRDTVRLTGLRELVAHQRDARGVAVTAVAGWALIVEVGGTLGVTDEVAVALSAGTTLVSHFRNVDAVDRFLFVCDGDVRLDFEPMFPTTREGSDPDGLLREMEQAGFDLADEDVDDLDDLEFVHSEAAFALAERLTGVRLTAELLNSAAYLGAAVSRP